MTTQKWRMVPVEPTPEMMRSGMNVPINKAARHNAVYRSMLEAAPQPPKSEPIAYIEHHKGGDNLVWDNPGGKYSALYTAPPAPSVPDEELQAAFDRGLKAGNGQKEAQQVEIHRLHDLLAAAPQPPRLSDERILHHLDAILKASGSGMKNYSMHKTIEDMKQAVRAIEREILGGNE